MITIATDKTSPSALPFFVNFLSGALPRRGHGISIEPLSQKEEKEEKEAMGSQCRPQQSFLVAVLGLLLLLLHQPGPAVATGGAKRKLLAPLMAGGGGTRARRPAGPAGGSGNAYRPAASPASPASLACTIDNCNGLNLRQAIRDDLDLWKQRGGINLIDVEAAQKRGCKEGEEDAHFFSCIKGWVRIMIVNNTLWANNMGTGWGTRDGVFLVALLEILERFKGQIPDVDFVLQPGDRSKVETPKHPLETRVLPLTLSFVTHPESLEIGLPDPSFWGWPEMGVEPHWLLLQSSDIYPWSQKDTQVFWRGGVNRRFAGTIRKRITACHDELTAGGRVAKATIDKINIFDAMRLAAMKHPPNTTDCRDSCASWVGPMHMCRSKIALFVQGEGYTSSKQRILGCGSLPVFLEHDENDNFFDRWLKEGKHYMRIRNDHICEDLAAVIEWVEKNDETAEKIGRNARLFSTTILSESMLHLYIFHVLKEVAALQNYDVSEAWEEHPELTLMTTDNIVSWFRLREERKGSIMDIAKKGVFSASTFRKERRRRWNTDESFLKPKASPLVSALKAPPGVGKH